MKRRSIEELTIIHRLRQTLTPAEIAAIVNSTPGAISRLLSAEKKKYGITYPKLRHGLLKYDKQIIAEWRSLKQQGKIYKDMGVHPGIVCRAFAKDNHGEVLH